MTFPESSLFMLGLAGFSLTFEVHVEGHWLVSRQVPCKTEGGRPEPLGGPGACSPGKFLELKSPRSDFPAMWERNLRFVITYI